MYRGYSKNMAQCNGSWRAAVVLASVCALVGCASKVPQAIRQAPVGQPVVKEVRLEPQRFVGTRVRWGGELVELANLQGATELEILARPLAGDGEPDLDGPADARFIARWAEFLDPADYEAGQRITVAGVVRGTREGLVGEYRYLYPVVEADALHRWPEPVPIGSYAYPPYFGWPYYDPWWPHYPHFWRPYW
jgi:outer membrane lipoprotein